MVIEGRIAGLPECAVKTVRRTMALLPFDVYLGQTSRAECKRKMRQLDNTHIIMVYDTVYKVFIAWNANIRKALCAGENVVYDVSTKLLRRHINEGFQGDSIIPLYISRNGTNRKSNGYEKVLLIGRDALYEFCGHYDHYLYPCEDDAGYTQPSLFASPKHELCQFERVEFNPLIRVKSLFVRARRAYGRNGQLSRCAVCGIDEPTVLETVPLTETDCETLRWVCLCSNHRAMYEHGILDVEP